MIDPIESTTMRRVYGRLMPLLFAMMFFNYLDRINIGFAALDMNKQSASAQACSALPAAFFSSATCSLKCPATCCSIALARGAGLPASC